MDEKSDIIVIVGFILMSGFVMLPVSPIVGIVIILSAISKLFALISD